jgi:hypothetical protein
MVRTVKRRVFHMRWQTGVAGDAGVGVGSFGVAGESGAYSIIGRTGGLCG